MLDPAYERLSQKINTWSVELKNQWVDADSASVVSISDHYELEVTLPAQESPHDDKPLPPSDTETMTDITREELDAKLEALESRMDSRVASIGGKIDLFLAVQLERDKGIEFRFGRIESDLTGIKADLKSSGADINSLRRWQAAYAAGVTLLAFIIGIGVTVAVRLMSVPPLH
ncbi:hypothetical protein [Pseudomonas fragariae (ex Marin et al. 2024)]|uniref:hypothetical protein n=1 Tax=Pseudomonas fragariae (ex Marin et al. 2024) TaxID=3080056 RepID=UPI003F7A72BF